MRHIVVCHTSTEISTLPGSLAMGAFIYRDLEKSGRPKAAFIRLDSGIGFIDGWLKCEYLLLFLGNVFRQEFIFGQIVNYHDKACLRGGTYIAGISKLILFDKFLPASFQIPCLTCRPITYSRVRIINIRGIRKLWDANNRDMQEYKVTVLGSTDGTCGLFHWGYVNLEYTHFCPIATIAEKYNLTMVQNTRLSRGADVGFGFVLETKDGTSVRNYIYGVTFRYVNFMTVTNPPSTSSGVEAFIKPFDGETWAFLLITIVLVAGFLTRFREENNHSSYVLTVVDRFITVACILLGQVGDSTGKVFSSVKVSLILVILWLYGNFLVTSNLYQGSIYSLLTVPSPPNIPESVEDLVNWDIHIVASNVIYGSRVPRLFVNVTIQELISSGLQSPKFLKFLAKFQARLLSNYDALVKFMVSLIIQGTGNQESMALLLFEDELENEKKFISTLGNRHVVVNKGDSPFRSTVFSQGQKNLLAPYFRKEFRRLEESGLGKKWASVAWISSKLRQKKTHFKKNKQFRVTQTWLGNLKEGALFHEATPVSIELIWPMFIICAVVTALGIVGFAVENKRFVARVSRCGDSNIVLGF